MAARGWKEGTKEGAVNRERRDQKEKSQLAEYINVDVTFGFLVHIVE